MQRNYKDISLWKNVTQKEWDSWQWQLANRITTLEGLGEVVNLTEEEREGVKPQYLISQSPDKVVLRNYEGVLCTYTEPADKERKCNNCGLCDKYKNNDYKGLEKLFREEKICLTPKNNVRIKRREEFNEDESRSFNLQ